MFHAIQICRFNGFQTTLMMQVTAHFERTPDPDDLLVDEAVAERLRANSLSFPSLTLSRRQLCDLELLLNGGFSPLQGFMARATYEGVVAECRLPDGSPWPIPVVLDVDADFAAKLEPGQTVALRDSEGFMPAALEVSEIWEADSFETIVVEK